MKRRVIPVVSGTGAFEVVPERAELTALAFDPVRELEASGRPVCFTVAPGSVPAALGWGSGEPGQSSLGYIFATPKESHRRWCRRGCRGVGGTRRRLSATIDPKAFDTTMPSSMRPRRNRRKSGERFVGAREAPVDGGCPEGRVGLQSVAVSSWVSFRARNIVTGWWRAVMRAQAKRVKGRAKRRASVRSRLSGGVAG